jgi:hypothetical protein
MPRNSITPRFSVFMSRAATFASLALMLIAGLAAGQMIAEQTAAGDPAYGVSRAPRGGGVMIGRSCPVTRMMTGMNTPAFGEGRIAFLKAELGVTEAQTAVWNAYAEALKRNFENMKSMRQTLAASLEGRTPVDRLDAHVAAMESRLEALKKLKPSLKTFYETLSPEQRRTANTILTGMACMI